MKVLIVSHTCIGRTSNMGKTLFGYFRSFSPEELAQVYLHSQVPEEDGLCGSSYRFTDLDALRHFFFLRSGGTVFRGAAREPEKRAGWTRPLYRFGEKRTALGYGLRELLWRKEPWNRKDFWDWVEEFSPDVVFLAAGDYGFLYKIAQKVASRRGIPLAVCYVDDYFLHNRNSGTWLGRWVHCRFCRQARQTVQQAAEVYGICQSLAEEYAVLFEKPCRVLHTPASVEEGPLARQRDGIAYLGNLELGREENLVEIGRTLKNVNLPKGPHFLDVYSGTADPALVRQMCPENGIRFHGAVSAQTVADVMKNSLAVVHTESFLPRFQEITRFSVSAKIPDILTAGPCLLAYGPEGVASMAYLREAGAAYCITGREKLAQGLEEILTKEKLREEILGNARCLARENHGSSPLRGWLAALCREGTV